MKNLRELKASNREAGRYFWSPDAVKFFGHRDESDLIAGAFFVYSIQPPHGTRIYRVGYGVRTGAVHSIGPDFSYRHAALDWIDSDGYRFRDACDGACYGVGKLTIRKPMPGNAGAYLCFDCWCRESAGGDPAWQQHRGSSPAAESLADAIQ